MPATKRGGIEIVTLGSAVWLMHGSAVAAGATTATDSGADQLQEIVVTAEKRSQDIKEVPLSISVLSSDALQSDHVQSYEDITRALPSVSFLSGGGPGLDNISIRGISSTSGAATVGLYLDEVPITVKNLWNGAIQPKLFDLARVEVLRGPQGTLYGASSMGGTIRFISNTPDLTQLQAQTSVDISTTRNGGTNGEVTGVLNLPLISNVAALRIAADVTGDSGYIDNYSPSTGALRRDGVNSDHTVATRLTLTYKPLENVSITPSLYYMQMTTDDTSVFYPQLGLWQQNKIVPEPSEIWFTVPSLTVGATFPGAELTSITSFFKQRFDRVGDATYYNSEYLGYLVDSDPILGAKHDGYLIGDLPGPEYSRTLTQQFTQEVRLASNPYTPGGSPITWLGGVYYSDQRVNRVVNDYVTGFDSTFTSIFGYPPQDSQLFAGQSFPGDAVALAGLQTDDWQYAGFGEVGLNVGPRFKATVGLRYSHGRSIFTEEQTGYFAGNTPSPYTTEAPFSSTTPRFTATLDVTPEISVYGEIAKGFRFGGGGVYVPTTICAADLATIGLASAPRSYDSDSLWSYEAGAKGRVLDNRIIFSASLYTIDWKNIQQTINLPTCGYSITTNVGDARSYGSEVELTAKPLPHWTLSINGGTTHATLTRVVPDLGASVGDWVLNTPEWTLNLGSEYRQPVGGDRDAFVRGTYAVVGPSYGSFLLTDPDHQRPRYSTLNLSFGTDIGRWRFSIYGTNLLDDTKVIQRPSLLFLEEAYTLRPRTIGITGAVGL